MRNFRDEQKLLVKETLVNDASNYTVENLYILSIVINSFFIFVTNYLIQYVIKFASTNINPLFHK